MEPYTPLRNRGVLPVPNDWTFRCMPRWKRALVIQRAYAASEAAHAASLGGYTSAAPPPTEVLSAENLRGAELEAAVRTRAAESLVRNCFGAAASWHTGKSNGEQRRVHFSARAPTQVVMEFGAQRACMSLWPCEYLAELESALRATARQCHVSVRPGARKSDVVVTVGSAKKPSQPATRDRKTT